MGIGDWGMGIGDWGLGIGPNPQSPIPNPQSPIPIFLSNLIFIFNLKKNYLFGQYKYKLITNIFNKFIEAIKEQISFIKRNI